MITQPVHMTPEEFKTIRTGLGLNRVDLAKAVGIGRDSLSNYEKGKWPIPLVVSHAMRWLQYRQKMS